MALIDEEPAFRAGRPVESDAEAKRPQVLQGPADQITSRHLRPRVILAQHIAPGAVKNTHFADDALVHDDDFEVTDPDKGLILTSPSGARWRVTVSDAGALQVAAVS